MKFRVKERLRERDILVASYPHKWPQGQWLGSTSLTARLGRGTQSSSLFQYLEGTPYPGCHIQLNTLFWGKWRVPDFPEMPQDLHLAACGPCKVNHASRRGIKQLAWIMITPMEKWESSPLSTLLPGSMASWHWKAMLSDSLPSLKVSQLWGKNGFHEH